jgi:tetratricopeptide (TPR) repeat protein
MFDSEIPDSRSMVTRFLASFCNTGHEQARFCLGLFEHEGNRLSFRGFVDMKTVRRSAAMSGMTGLCRHDGVIYCGLQTAPSTMVAIRQGAPEFETIRLKNVRNFHSAVSYGDRILIVSTGADCVVSFDPQTRKEEVVYRVSSAGRDTLHLNGIALYRGSPVISMKGPNEPETGKLRTGEVRNLVSGQTLIQGLREPHSVFAAGDELFVLESATAQLIGYAKGRVRPVASLAGYLRGLHVGRDLTLIGRSGYRTLSASFGADRNRPYFLPDDKVPEPMRSAIYALKAGGEFIAIETSDIAHEVYDLLELTDAEAEYLGSRLVPTKNALLHRAVRSRDADALRTIVKTGGGEIKLEAALELAVLRKRHGAAIDAAAKLAQRRPDDVERWERLSRLQFEQADLAGALVSSRKALSLQKDSVALLLWHAQVATEAKSVDEALSSVDGALKLEPNGAGLHFHRSLILELANDYDGAIGSAERAVALNHSARFRVNLARLLRLAQRIPDARTHLEAVLADEPDNAEANYQRSLLAVEAKEEEQSALEHARAAVRGTPRSVSYAVHLAELLAQSKEFEEGRAVLAAIASAKQESAAPHYARAQLEQKANKRRAAQEAIAEALRLEPQNQQYKSLAASLKKKKRKPATSR